MQYGYNNTDHNVGKFPANPNTIKKVMEDQNDKLLRLRGRG